jgi:hypothetical protein
MKNLFETNNRLQTYSLKLKIMQPTIKNQGVVNNQGVID